MYFLSKLCACSLVCCKSDQISGVIADIFHNFYLTSVILFLSTASAHTFNNSRTSYSHQTDFRQERTEERGDVRKWAQIMGLYLVCN